MQPVVLITGAAGGLGRALAQRFHQGNWRVVVTDQNAAGVSQLGHEMPLAGSITADLRSAEACRDVIERTLGRVGRLDALVNAAGIWREGPVDTFSEEDFDLVMAVNLKAPFFMCSAAIPHLKETRGCIVNISSDAGHQGNQNAAAYCASKGGLTLLGKTLALDLAPHGVRVNTVSPGDIDTPMLAFQAQQYGNGNPMAYYRGLLDKYPQGDKARFVQPAEVAELVYFLCQPTASAITGADLAIDLGLSAGK